MHEGEWMVSGAVSTGDFFTKDFLVETTGKSSTTDLLPETLY